MRNPCQSDRNDYSKVWVACDTAHWKPASALSCVCTESFSSFPPPEMVLGKCAQSVMEVAEAEFKLKVLRTEVEEKTQALETLSSLREAEASKQDGEGGAIDETSSGSAGCPHRPMHSRCTRAREALLIPRRHPRRGRRRAAFTLSNTIWSAREIDTSRHASQPECAPHTPLGTPKPLPIRPQRIFQSVGTES